MEQYQAPISHGNPPEPTERFRLETLIGKGGMGSVYKAYDNVLERFVAVKLLHHELSANEGAIQRMKREIQLASRITNQHVVRTYDFGEMHGASYISMALIEGRNLREVIKRQGSLTPETATRYAIQIATALQAAHAAAVIHRDLKPQNILIDSEDNVFVADFGLAKPLDEDASLLTQGDDSPGTPQYMSPEQCFGLPLDQRTDIFSFGAVLYEMVTGEAPFVGLTLLRAVQGGHKLEHKDPRSVNPQLPEGLCRLVARCLEGSPEDRFSTMSDVLAELEPLGEASEPPRQASRLHWPTLRRWHKLALPLAFGMLALALLVLVTGIQRSRSSRVAENFSAQGAYQEAREVLSRQHSTADIEEAVARLEGALRMDPGLVGAYTTLVEASLLLYQETQDRRWLDRATDAAGRARALKPDLPQTNMALARLYISTGHSADAVRLLKQVLGAMPDSDEAWRILGKAYLTLGSPEDGIRAAEQAVRSNPPDWRNHDLLAAILFSSRRFRESEVEYQTVLQLNPNRPDTYNNLGVIYLQSGQYDRAFPLLEKALQMDPRPAYFNNVGTAYLETGQYRLAAALFEKAASLQPSSDVLRGNLAEAYRLSGDPAHAAEALDAALRLARASLAVNPSDRRAKTRLALYYVRMENFSAAEALIAELGVAHPNDCQVTYVYAVLRQAQHRVSESMALLDKALRQGFPAVRALADPDWKALRGEPRFKTMLKKYGTRA